MPTGIWMFGVSRGRSVVVAALLAVGALPAAAASATGSTPSSTSTTSTTTTTMPPPASFTLPSNIGYQLVQQLQDARTALKAAQARLGGAKKQQLRVLAGDVLIRREINSLDRKLRETQQHLDDTRTRLRAAAAEAYVHAGSGELMAAISSILNQSSAVDVGRQLHVISTYGITEQVALDEFLALQQRVESQRARVSDLADRSKRDLAAAAKVVNDLRAQIKAQQAKILFSIAGITQFHEAATSALSPILGPSRMTAKQMADFVISQKYQPNITVPLEQLAQDYLDEGNRTGVRGDVAWAQSILETAGFANPGSAATNNNFAGIGWCDTCAHGFDFPDANTGVRAQLQLLRIYVDPAFPDKTYTDKILLPGTLKLGFRGKVQTWWDLWGTWATGALYGQRVYDIYEHMVVWAAYLDPTPPPGASTTTTTTIPKKP